MNNQEESNSSMLTQLKNISNEIKISWYRDCDKTKYIIELTNMIKEILTKESLEEFFSNNEENLTFFMGEFLQEVIGNILIQPKIYGDNGDKIALDLLANMFKLFLKFHKNNKYSPLFEKIRFIFYREHGSTSFFTSHRYEDNEKNYDFSHFNSKFCQGFEKIFTKKFKIGDEIDFIIENDFSNNNLDKKSWVRGRIKDIKDGEYIIEYFEYGNKYIPIKDYNIFEKNTKTKDWDWRTSLKKYDIIDCYDRNKWYPSTVVDVVENEINGYKKIQYKIAFRLYPEHFKNLEDENDTYDKHIDIWKLDNQDIQINTDDENEKYIGDGNNSSEYIYFYSKRIQKFNTYSACQQKYLKDNYSSGYFNINHEEEKNPMKIMNDKLANDTNIDIDEFFNYEKEGKKNYIIGKPQDFYYYFAYLLKMLEKENTFSKFIEILQNQPNSEEIYNIFFFLTFMFPYLHRNYFKENCNAIKNSLLNYINGLNEKEMRSMPKDLIEIISNLLLKINEYKDEDPTNDLTNLYDEITLTLSIKTIKTSIFDRRLQGIKALNDYIEKNKNNKEALHKIIDLIKKNDIIKEIFGANYHSQIISRATEVIQLLLVENELSEDDIKLIWSCTKKGDLEAKLTILQLLSKLAPNLKDNYIEMLLNNIRMNVDNKNNDDEIDLVYKLSIYGQNNEKNIEYLCDYLCQCLLMSNDPDLTKSPILEKIFIIIDKDIKYLKKFFDICENSIKKNEKTILSYSILFEIIDKKNEEYKEIINDFKKDKHLLNLFEDNFKLYIKQAKDLLNKNNISEPEVIDKFIIDGFTHLKNIEKRMEIYPFLVNKYYTDYDFIPFLKDTLITNAVCPNDKLIFYDFVKKYITDNNNINNDAVIRKEKIKQELFEFISEDNQTDITVEQLKLFIALFFDMNNSKIKFNEYNKFEGQNRDEEYGIKHVENIDELKGLDKFWSIIFQIKEKKVLYVAINFIFQLYKNEIEKLLEKFISPLKEESNTLEKIEKCITLLKLIIIESEKQYISKPKSHLSLLKNCLIRIPLMKEGSNDLLFGNTSINELKVILSKIYNMSPDDISLRYTEKYLKFLKKNNLIEKEDVDESDNNSSLYDLLLKNDNIKSDFKPEERLVYNRKKIKKVKLMVDNEMNPKLIKILKEWYEQFTEGTGKMDEKGIINFIRGVLGIHSDVSERRIQSFMENDKEGKGYVSEEEFINFYKNSIKNKSEKNTAVWDNLRQMGVREDLRKKNETFEIKYIQNEKLPRYILGNDLSFIENLIQKYYKSPNSNTSLLDFLFYLTTNESIYNDILEGNLYAQEEGNSNKESFIYKGLNYSNNYAELNYIFIIIESIFQDLEIYLYDKFKDKNYSIIFNDYRIFSEVYEPFDNEDKIEKKINFVKNLMKAENLQKLIKQINEVLEKLIKAKKDCLNMNIISKLYDICLRGLKIINIINKFNSEEENHITNCLNELKEKGIYTLGFCNLSSLFPDVNIKDELNKISYLDLINNLINYLNDSEKQESNTKNNKGNNVNDNNDFLQKECLDILINVLSTNKQLLIEYTTKDETKKNILINLFRNYFSDKESINKIYFIQKITKSINKPKNIQNIDYINFLFQIITFLLDNLISSPIDCQSDIPEDNDKINFTPDSTFFELYSNLYKIISEIKDKNNESTNDKEKENANVLRIYELIMKNINYIEQKKEINYKIFLSLLQLLKTQIINNDKLKNEILFKETDGNTLFNFIFKILVSQISTKRNNNESLIDSDDNDNETNENEEKKFICLDDIKEEKKDDSSNKELIEISNEFLISCLEGTQDPKMISELLKIIGVLKSSINKNENGTNNNGNENNDRYQMSYSHYASKSCGHVGLRNLGCICYMNSIMQQIYMVPTFRYAIMSADDGEPPKPTTIYRYVIDDDNLLHQLQNMFTFLTYSNKMDYNPRNFCLSYKDFDGNPINVREQQDSQEFYNNLCDKIEESLKKTKYKYIVSDVFSGKTCSSVLCENCKHISYRFEDFYNLTLEVKNIYNLKDSLNKLNVPEIIDDFKCSKCEQKVRISKVTSLNKLPNVLVVHLKRFYLNYETCNTEKINSRFEFPKKLNLKHFSTEEITKTISGNENDENKNETLEIYNREDEYYEYELKGINVHTGSADGGHYFSFIDVNRDGNNNLLNENTKENWLQFNDSHVSEFDIDTIPSECYGGSLDGRNYENCQNAYLLIYERKKKTPIKILIDEKDIDKDKDNIIKIDKDNKKQIIKEYDLSRINNNIKDEDLYKKIFFDEEKNEYYKYIPYYNIPKYAPRKIYNEIMKDNNAITETSSDSNKNSINYNKYKSILLSIIEQKQFDINNENYNDSSKEIVISIVLNELFSLINNGNLNDRDKIDINSSFSYIINQLIKPLIKKDTNISILKTIINSLNKYDNLIKIFNNRISRDDIFNNENAQLISDVLYDLINILFEKTKDVSSNELNMLYQSLQRIIKNSITTNNNYKDKYNVIYLFQLLYKLIQTNEEFLKYFIEKEMAILLLNKISNENEKIRKIIYDILIYMIKNTKDYNKELFDLNENEKEGEYIFEGKEKIFDPFDMKIINLIFEEKNELLIMLIVIIANDNILITKQINYQIIYSLYEICKEKNIINNLLELLLSLATINDRYAYQRFIHILGYPNPIIKQIPRVKKKYPQNNNYFGHDLDDDNCKEKENEDIVTPKQKWPLFGERLINGDIKKHIYEYVGINHRENGLCLLRLLFPNESDITEENEENNDDEIDGVKKRNKINISNEVKKNIILKLLKICFGDKKHYPLFKYIYLMPARCLLYKNLYEEIKKFIKEEDKAINLENYSTKEEKYINKINKEIKKITEIIKMKENGNYNYNIDDDNCPKPGEEEFKCYDQNIKYFTGFINDIIPGEVVREEIILLAKTRNLALYRIQYFTKYFKVEELRNSLLNKNNKTQIENKEENKESTKDGDIKTKEINKEDNKNQNNDNKEEKEGEQKGEQTEEKEEKDENKNLENKKEDDEKEQKENKLEKKDKLNKDEENKQIDKKDEDKKKDETKMPENKENLDDNNKRFENNENKEEENKKEEKKEEKVDENKENKEEKNKKEEEKEEKKKPEKKDEKEEKKQEEKKEKDQNKAELKEEEKKNEENPCEKKNEEEKNNDSDKEEKEKTDEKKEGEEKEEEEEEITETDLNNSLEKESNYEKYDISEKNENDFIYKRTQIPIILEDKSIKKRNKVIRTLHRFIFTNFEEEKKYFTAYIKSNKLKDIYKINSFFVSGVYDKIEPQDMVNFFNITRFRGDLPFLERDNGGVSIDMGDDMKFNI